MTDQADLVIVGAGTVGGWASVFAAADGAARTVVVERGLAGMGASSRAAGIVRAQGGTPATVALGRWTIDFYNGQQAAYGTDSGFRELGYLILAVTDDDETAGRERLAMQRANGLDAAWLDAAEAVTRRGDARPDRPPGRFLYRHGWRDRSAPQRARLLARDAGGRRRRCESGRRSPACAPNRRQVAVSGSPASTRRPGRSTRSASC